MRTVSLKQQRTNSARKHALRVYTCICGQVCRGNGGRTSHRKVCPAVKAARDARAHDIGWKP